MHCSAFIYICFPTALPLTMSAEVCWSDQERINEFSRLNLQATSIKSKLELFEDQKESIDDAIAELELASDDHPIPFLIGSSYVDLSCSQAIELLNEQASTFSNEIAQLLTSKSDLESRMAHLKSTLYAKFGKTINLES